MGAVPCGGSQLAKQQLFALQAVVDKYISDPGLRQIATGDDFHATSTERGLLTWEHAHLIAALDILNAYQIDRKANRIACGASTSSKAQDDPETRLVELLKRWLRQNAANASVSEDEVRSMYLLSRDVLNHRQLFASGRKGAARSFLCAVAEVHDHLRWQLRETLERDRTCAELMQRALSLGRNLVSDVVAYLLLGPTALRQTDALPSVEVVALWQCLPSEGHPMPTHVDIRLQKEMRGAWRTRCGSLIAALLVSPACLRLFGAGDAAAANAIADADAPAMAPLAPELSVASAVAAPPQLRELIEEAWAEFERGSFRDSGLAAAFHAPGQRAAWQAYLATFRELGDLVFILGEVMMQFQRLGAGLGDCGVIRAAPWLHPCLEAFAEKLRRLRSSLEQLNTAVDEAIVFARARGLPVKKPHPSRRMSARAHGALERATFGRSTHLQALAQATDDLKSRSAVERLPHVMEGLGSACAALQLVFASSQFRLCMGDVVGELPPVVHEAPAKFRYTTRALDDSASVQTRESWESRESGCRLTFKDESDAVPFHVSRLGG